MPKVKRKQSKYVTEQLDSTKLVIKRLKFPKDTQTRILILDTGANLPPTINMSVSIEATRKKLIAIAKVWRKIEKEMT